MPLSSLQLEILTTWVSAMGQALGSCPICGATNWHAYSDLTPVAVLDRNLVVPQPLPVEYMARIGCGQCVYSILVPADAIGVLVRTV